MSKIPPLPSISFGLIPSSFSMRFARPAARGPYFQTTQYSIVIFMRTRLLLS